MSIQVMVDNVVRRMDVYLPPIVRRHTMRNRDGGSISLTGDQQQLLKQAIGRNRFRHRVMDGVYDDNGYVYARAHKDSRGLKWGAYISKLHKNSDTSAMWTYHNGRGNKRIIYCTKDSDSDSDSDSKFIF